MSDKKELKRLRDAAYREKNKEKLREKQLLYRKNKKSKATTCTTLGITRINVNLTCDDMKSAVDTYLRMKPDDNCSFVHVVAYGNELFQALCTHYGAPFSYCYCGPRGGEPTHIHGLFLLDKTKGLPQFNFVVPGRYHALRTRNVKCIKHYVACLHYMGCTRPSISNKFKKVDHCHSFMRSPFPFHDRELCTGLIKTYVGNHHDDKCDCLKFWDKKTPPRMCDEE